MEPKTDIPKLPDMVMCGDHPSFNKTELNAKEALEEKELPVAPCAKRASAPSLEEKPERTRRARVSAHALRPARAAGPALSVTGANAHGGALVQAALGSFRWPPYLLTVWVLVLVLTHALHCLVSCLERALPRLRNLCQYMRMCTERSWRTSGGRAGPLALATITATLYAVYCALYVAYSVAVWAIEPLSVEDKAEEEQAEAKVTDYVEEATKSDDSLK